MRSENDTWDILTGPGVTALFTSALRAIEADRPDALARDLLARHFLDAITDRAPGYIDVVNNPGQSPALSAMVTILATRTRFLDEFFSEAFAAGITQAVLLASGLDTRAYRLEWPTGSVVFDNDLPSLLQFKVETLAKRDVLPKAEVRLAGADLRADWPSTLRKAGFDESQPTIWLAEGLLPFLPGAAQDALFKNVQSLSAPGSRLAVEDWSPSMSVNIRAMLNVARELRVLMNINDVEPEPDSATDDPSFWYDDERGDPVLWLTENDWKPETHSIAELVHKYHRAISAAERPYIDGASSMRYLTAIR